MAARRPSGATPSRGAWPPVATPTSRVLLWAALCLVTGSFLGCWVRWPSAAVAAAFRPPPSPRRSRALFVVIGAAFRIGPQNTNDYGVKEGYHLQREASGSHTKFAAHVTATHGLAVDFLLVTYPTPFDDDLRSYYAAHRLRHATLPALAGRNHTLAAMLRLLGDPNVVDLGSYAFVHYFRMDQYLKHAFLDAFKLSKRVRWTYCMWQRWTWADYHASHNEIVPRVADLAMYIPHGRFDLITNASLHEHMEHWSYLVLREQGVPHTDLGFMVDTFHDSDSGKDWNPLYYVVSRTPQRLWFTNDGEHVVRHFGFNKSVVGTFRFMATQPGGVTD